MVDTYANAANGGRIGFNMGGGADMDAPKIDLRTAISKEAEIMQKLQMPNVNDQDRAILQEQLRSLISQPPCRDCSKLIHQAGIVRVVYAKTYKDVTGLEFSTNKFNKDIEGLRSEIKGLSLSITLATDQRQKDI